MDELETPTEEQIELVWDEAIVLEAEGKNPYPGSTYVAGVRAALGWVLGETEDAPLEVPE